MREHSGFKWAYLYKFKENADTLGEPSINQDAGLDNVVVNLLDYTSLHVYPNPQYVYLVSSRQPFLPEEVGPRFGRAVYQYMCFIDCFYILKYLKKKSDMASYTHSILTADVDNLLKIDRKSNCTLCEFCTAVACVNLWGGAVPGTPSPYSSPQTPRYNLDEEYNSLYRDFKHASQIELRENKSSKEGIDHSDLNGSVEERFREIIYPFTRSVYSVFTKLVDDFLNLFEEMIRGLILLKETGITMEDICSIDEKRQTFYSLQTSLTMRMDPMLSSCQPYNITEFEKLLEQELRSQLGHVLQKSQGKGENTDQFYEKSLTLDNEETTSNNHFLTFLTEINCHNLHSCDTAEFDNILVTEKKMYLKNCLKLLRENEYFYVHSQSSSDSEKKSQFTARAQGVQPEIVDNEMYKMSSRIYNQTVCHVQSAIIAIFRSMKYGEQEKDRLFSETTDVNYLERSSIHESQNLIQKSLSQYMNSGTGHRNQLHFQTMPSMKYENEISTRFSRREASQKELTLPQQHPDLGYSVDGKHHMCKHQRKIICEHGNKKDVRYMCILNHKESEVSHKEAIKFLKYLKEIGGVLHYSHNSENPFLTKVEGPSFYFTILCTECRQELAPPKKLEAFRSAPETDKRSKLMAFIRKSRAFFYFPVKCDFFLCDPKEARKRRLHVQLHSSAMDFICASRIRSHKCQVDNLETEYKGCIADSIRTSVSTQNKKTYYEESSKQGHSREVLFSAQRNCLVRSRSSPALVGDNKLLKFEDAVTDILNMWTYEMINYEKEATSPHSRAQILNYRKSLSVYIKKDIREKFYQRLSISEHVEDFESPILKFEDRATHAIIGGDTIKRSRSCHSKLRYEQSTHHKSKSLIQDYSVQMSKFQHALSEVENDAKLTRSFQLENRHHVRSQEQNNNTIFKSRHSMLDNQNCTNRPNSKLQNKRIIRPVSLHSELKDKSVGTYPRRSSSFDARKIHTSGFTDQINAWQTELQELQKSVGIGSPHLRSDILNSKNITRPLSLHSELKQYTPNTNSRRSISFGNESAMTDEFSDKILAWQNELKKLQKCVESPYTSQEVPLRKHLSRQPTIQKEDKLKSLDLNNRRRSNGSFATDYSKDLSNEIRRRKGDLLKHLRPKTEIPKNFASRPRPHSLHSELALVTPAYRRRRSCSLTANLNSKEDLLTQVTEWKNELIALQENAISSSAAVTPKIIIKTTWLSAQNSTAKTLNQDDIAQKDKMLQLREGVTGPPFKSAVVDRKTIAKGNSFHTVPKHETTGTNRRRHKSDSEYQADQFSSKIKAKDELVKVKRCVGGPLMGTVTSNFTNHSDPRPLASHRQPEVINEEFSAELSAWEQELLDLQKSAESPFMIHEIQKRKPKTRSISLDSEPKPNASLHFQQCEVDDELPELITWNHSLRELENNATSPRLRSQSRNYKIKTREMSLHSEAKHIPKSSNRPKSESVLDFSMELYRWKHQLQTLEEDAKSPQLVTPFKDMAKSQSLDSEPIYKTPANVHTSDIATHTSGALTYTNSHDIISQHKSSGRRYGAKPRNLPSVPVTSTRRHSHYETTTNFIPLLCDKKATRLWTHNSTLSNSNQTRISSAEPTTDAPSGLLRSGPDARSRRSRLFSQ